MQEIADERTQPLREQRAATVDADERHRPVRMLLGAAPGGFFSTISCAMRTSVRRMSSWSRMTVSGGMLFLPGLSGPG